MNEDKINVWELDGVKINTHETTMRNIVPIVVEAGTNGQKGGNTSAGSRTFISMKAGGGDIHFSVEEDGTLQITAGGDEEFRSLLDALSYIHDVLVSQAFFKAQ